MIEPKYIEKMFGGDWNNKYVHKIYWQYEMEQVARVQKHRAALAEGEDPDGQADKETDKLTKASSSKRKVRKKKSKK